ncbi:MAG: hypothetical protein MSH40_02870 [Christensenella sp.]|nr:hypothetical protein [Christensenella sp.]
MNKKFLYLLTIIVLVVSLTICFSSCSKKGEYGVNVLTNSSFEEKGSNGLSISNWVASDSTSVSFISNTRDDDAYNVKLGKYYANIKASGQYVYLAQNVTLEKNEIYRITAIVKVDSIVEKDGIGLRFGFDTDADFYGLNIVDVTDDEWIDVEYYFTSSTNKEVKFVIGVGSPNITTSGVVYVDNVVLEKVKEVPNSYLEQVDEIEVLKFADDYSLNSAGSISFVVIMSIVSLLMVAGIWVLLKLAKKGPSLKVELHEEQEQIAVDKNKEIFNKIVKFLSSNFAMFLYVLVGAFLIRFIISICSFGMVSQIDSLETLAESGVKEGLLSFYSVNESSSPVGITLLYTILGHLAQVMNIKVASLGYSLLMRLPLVIADIVIVYSIYAFASKHADERQATVYAGIYAFMPIFFFHGAFYGSTETIGLMFIILTLMALLNKDYIFTSLLYTLALLFSNFALIILPIILIFEVYAIITDSENKIALIISMFASFVIFFALALLATWDSVRDGNVFEYFKRMYKYFQDIKYLTLDSFNIYAIFGAGSSKGRTTLIEVLNWLFVAGMSACPAYLYIKNKNRSDLVLYAGLMFVAYGVFGAGSLVTIMPIGLAILVLYLVIVPENRMMAASGSLATLSFLNIAQLASQSGFISAVEGAQYVSFEPKSAFMIIFSIITVLISFYLIYVAVDVSFYSQASEITPFKNGIKSDILETISSFKKKSSKAKVNRK